MYTPFQAVAAQPMCPGPVLFPVTGEISIDLFCPALSCPSLFVMWACQPVYLCRWGMYEVLMRV